MQVTSRSSIPAISNKQYRPGWPESGEHPSYVFEPLAYWASVCPEKQAVSSETVRLSYAELEARTNQLARRLMAEGVRPGEMVAFVLPRGVDAVLLMISILKAGGAYVPIDADSPPTRIRECLEDARPKLLLAYESNVAHLLGGGASIPVERLLQEAREYSAEPVTPDEIGLERRDRAYVIFTSGSTGRPKGVPISHAALTNFVVGDQETCIRVAGTDRVFQGFSPASDGHHEEVWPTFLAGATLVVGSSKIVHSGPDLLAFLNEQQVSVISCAPTLLSMVDGDVPTLRKILFGAESLPPAIVERWWRPNRQILNTYGPTEATVGATFGVCEPGKPITIGKPLPNYRCFVLDGEGREVQPGIEGQLALAGIGLSEGYLGRDDLTVEKFVNLPQGRDPKKAVRVYLTGDRVRQDADGNYVWLGRIDAQVKIRGHRVELTEIENQALSFPGVRAVALISRATSDGDSTLVALLALAPGEELSMAAFLTHVRDALPAYMVPQAVETVDALPVLPSGKLDRKACAGLHGVKVRIDRDIVPPRSATEQLIFLIWQRMFPQSELSCSDDFFIDLGGYSLLASRFISELRSDHGLTSASVADLYESPTIRSFAAHLEANPADASQGRPEFHEVPSWRFRAAAAVQGVAILFLYAIQAFLWLGPIILAIELADIGFSETVSVIIGLAVRAAMVPVVLGLVVLLKWTVVGRFKEGRYPVWGGVFLRWWFFNRLMSIAPTAFLTGTPFAASYIRLLGAKVGRNVLFESMEVDCPDLISIGDSCSFENASWLHAAEVTQGELHIRPIRIAKGCVAGVRVGIAGGAVLEEGATLRDLTCVTNGATVPAYEEWCGSPARRAERQSLPKFDPQAQPSRSRWVLFGVVYSVCVLLLTILESVPFVVVGYTLYSSTDNYVCYLWEPVYAVVLVCFAVIQALLIKWLVLGRLKPGEYAFPSMYGVRKWFTDRHLECMLSELLPIYDSLFARSWCQALGMKCGPRCEIAPPRRMPYDLVEMGEESFLASEVSIGMPIRRNGRLFLERTKVANRVFLGNDSVIPQGAEVPTESLLGLLSVWPDRQDCGDGPAQAWLGSPPFRMPRRQVHNQFDVRQTYQPTRKLYLQRLAHEAFRLVLPSLFMLAIGAMFIEAFVAVWNQWSIRVALAASPLIYLALSFLGAGMCWLSKRILVGKYVPTVSPLWSTFVWRAETYSAVLHDFGMPTFFQPMIGTPYLASFMRFLGAKIGKRTFLNTNDWTETDLIRIGDDVAINTSAPLQAHLFEDRVMKVGPITIGDRCSVGYYSIILCDTELRHDAHVGHMSLVMKGETIPSNTFWVGAPVQAGRDPVRRPELTELPKSA